MGMGRLLAVSDVHGYGHLLKQLLNAAGYRPDQDQLILLGDYVNKGPDSWGTLQLVYQLTLNGAVALQGNNERKWLASMPNPLSEDHTPVEHYRKFLERLPLYYARNGLLFVHAGVRPGIPLSSQSPEDLTEIRDPFFSSPVDPNYTVVFGHTSTYRFNVAPWEIWIGSGKVGIDTGAGHGHYLSLVDFTTRNRWYVSVQEPYEIQKAILNS
ncbi:metallophosphoesterase [Paenibacillus tundrae]|uniref:Serine/threonine protein phosphatase 1 n=1 Tax=Paenibacillus tundrae TaxID=528187 RepID=A0ABT9W8F5_9BACL|nr:metallophosphoesterase [Paenibacillus tundrae]MDQ0169354.1 serine/threonine protein phosphatase 1 [Paenibacillus tundrae]